MNAPALPGSVGIGLGLGAIALVAIAGVAFALYKNREKFDPTSDRNIAYRGVNSIGAALTGDKDFSLGSWIYDRVHPGEDPGGRVDPRDYLGADPVSPAPWNEQPATPFNVGA